MRSAMTNKTGARRTTVPSRLRRMLVLISALALLVVTLPADQAQSQQSQGSLQALARPGLAVGGMTNGWDSEYPAGEHIQIAETEFSAVTATMYMGWAGWLNPGDENISSAGLDAVVSWAKDDVGQTKEVHGHTLVYPLSNQALDWWINDVKKSDVENHEVLLERYVTKIASSNAGQVDLWHVVNEAFADPGDSRVGDYELRNDYIEYQSIGSDYVEKAFTWAKAADPNATLLLTDYGAEAEGPKADALFNYVTTKRAEGVPIDGVGLQFHIAGHGGEPDYASIRRNLQRFADAGIEVHITELDVSAKVGASALPAPTAAERARQARIYEEIARIASEQPAVKSLMMWDFVDNRSWLQPAITSLGVPGTPGHVPLGSYTYPTPWSGGRGELAVPNGNYDALQRGLSYRPDSDPNPDPVGAVPAGPTWLTSQWEPNSSYLARVGDFDGSQWSPGDSVYLQDLGSGARSWWSMQWIFEPVGPGEYRIRSRWGGDYLTREGVWNGQGWDAGDGLQFHPKNDAWSSQVWRLTPTNGSFSIVNTWEPSTGALTRLGNPYQGGYLPTAELSLDPLTPWSSQEWTLTEVG